MYRQSNKQGEVYQFLVNDIYPLISDEVFKPNQRIGFPEEGGTTGYWSHNMTKGDLKLVQDFLKNQSIDILNTRAFKRNGKYLITVGSISDAKSKKDLDFKGHKFDVQYGEFSEYLKESNLYIKEALKYAANDNQTQMI